MARYPNTVMVQQLVVHSAFPRGHPERSEGSGRGLVDPGFPPPRFLVAPLLGMTCSMANWYESRDFFVASLLAATANPLRQRMGMGARYVSS